MAKPPRFPPGYLTKSALKLMAGGWISFGVFEFLNGNEKFHKDFLMPLVHQTLDAETAHRLGVQAAKYRIMPLRGSSYIRDDRLNVRVFDKDFENPLGLAAGFDKDGNAIEGLFSTGFGFVEIGSVTPLPQSGNEKPRVFRLVDDQAVINRYGFNSIGHQQVLENVIKIRFKQDIERSNGQKIQNPCLLGVNLGKNKTSTDGDQDFCRGFKTFAPVCDYVVVNVSSPNTPGLRNMQRKKELVSLLAALNKTRRESGTYGANVPLLLKVSPDLSWEEKVDIAALCIDKSNGVAGLIVANTTISRPNTLKCSEYLKHEVGGLSGAPLKDLSTKCVKDFRTLTKGQMPIVACGGISSGADAYEKIRAGASLVQIYTSLVYQGFPVVGRIKRELLECLKRDGFAHVSDAVGVDCKL